jgi:glucose-6-phosphate isomerase
VGQFLRKKNAEDPASAAQSLRCCIPASTPIQRILPGRFESAYRAQLGRLAAESVLARIWEGKPDVWTDSPEHAHVIGNRLGWLASPEAMRRETGRLTSFAVGIRKSGFRDIILLGMGGSSLAPEVFSLTFPAPEGMRFFVLDSTDPEMILAAERTADLKRTLFLVASKSGTTVETLSQFRYFHARLEAAGITSPGQQFVAITDPGSPLETLARENNFRQVFLNDPKIGGRYSALSYFGLVPAALWGVPLETLLDGALAMREACGPKSPTAVNPALSLGTLLGVAAREGADKLALLATPTLLPLGNWIEQLVAESTGKQGKGIIPLAGEVPGPEKIFANQMAVVCLALEGEDRAELDRFAQLLAVHGVPLADIRLHRPEELGAEFFKWELATTIASAVLRVNPFDEPNVQESKDNTARILKSNAKPPRPVFSDKAIAVFAEPLLREKFQGAGLVSALQALFAEQEPGAYLALLAFIARTPENEAVLRELRLRLRDGLQMAVLAGFGPRYLHSIGQLYKGGPQKGRFLILTAEHPEDALIPGASYSFGQLELAQALGDYEALARRGRPVLRLHFEHGVAAGMCDLRAAIKAALSSSCSGSL